MTLKGNISRVGVLILLSLVFSAFYAGYWGVIAASDLTGNPEYNRYRLIEAENRDLRGRFLDRHGRPLAWSKRTPDGQVREYADPSLGHVVGYHSHLYGDSNLEESLAKYLNASVGLSPQYQLQSKLLAQPKQGADVTLTIDESVQKAAEAALGQSRGAVVALNPRSGEVLALVSHPGYNPTTLDDDWETLTQDEGAPLLNRATQGMYATGSTFKVVTLAALLDAGVVRNEDQVECQREILVEGYRIVSENQPAELTQTDVAHAFAYSCNTAFANLGLRLGGPRLEQAARQFGFEQVPPFDLPTSASYVYVTPDFLLSQPALAATAFGQGQLQASPLQMALVAAAIANDGPIARPFLVSQISSVEGAVLYQSEPKLWLQATSPETARQVKEDMVLAVREGWSAKAAIDGVTVAGKTGTAEIGGGRDPHAWFIGFAPAENPRVAVAVIIENGASGPAQAAPLAKQVMEAALASPD